MDRKARQARHVSILVRLGMQVLQAGEMSSRAQSIIKYVLFKSVCFVFPSEYEVAGYRKERSIQEEDLELVCRVLHCVVQETEIRITVWIKTQNSKGDTGVHCQRSLR